MTDGGDGARNHLFRHSEESRRKLREAHTGKKLTKAHKRKISKGMKGKQNTLGHPMAEGHKQKIRAALRGRIFSKAWRAKISKAKIGNTGARVRWDKVKAKNQ